MTCPLRHRGSSLFSLMNNKESSKEMKPICLHISLVRSPVDAQTPVCLPAYRQILIAGLGHGWLIISNDAGRHGVRIPIPTAACLNLKLIQPNKQLCAFLSCFVKLYIRLIYLSPLLYIFDIFVPNSAFLNRNFNKIPSIKKNKQKKTT